jgi:hypothetical protein
MPSGESGPHVTNIESRSLVAPKQQQKKSTHTHTYSFRLQFERLLERLHTHTHFFKSQR